MTKNAAANNNSPAQVRHRRQWRKTFGTVGVFIVADPIQLLSE
jgi:hypothetical protein